MDSPLLSIIIVSYNTREVLHECLMSVQREADLPHEAIVIDNASPDGSADMVAREFPAVRLVRNMENTGFSPANNVGMGMARGKYILLLNPDTVVRPGSISAWVAAHERVHATISGPKLVGQDGALQVSAWKIPGPMDAFLELLYLHRLFRRNSYPKARFDTDFEAGFVSGAAMLFERGLYKRIGGLDPEMFWMEDADLCLRVTKAGGTCWYVGGPGIVHIGGESSRKNMDRVISNQLISRIKFSRKHAGRPATGALILVVYLHVITRIIAFACYTLFRADPRAKAYMFTLGKLNRYLFKDDRSI